MYRHIWIIACIMLCSFGSISSHTDFVMGKNAKPEEPELPSYVRNVPTPSSPPMPAPRPSRPKDIPIAECRNIFAGCSEQEVLAQVQFFKYPGFRQYIQELPQFEDFIYFLCEKVRQACNDYSGGTRRLLERAMEDRFKNIVRDINECAQVVQQRQEARLQAERERQQELERQRQEQARQARERRREHEINTYGVDLDECLAHWNSHTEPHAGILDDVYRKRAEAVQHVRTDATTSEETYTMSPQADEVCADFQLERSAFETFHGDMLQHTIHNEYISIINELAPHYTTYKHIDGIAPLQKLTIRSLDVGRAFNENHDIQSATYIADMCWTLTHYMHEIVGGSKDGVVQFKDNTCHTITHPIQTVQNLASVVAWAAGGVINTSVDCCTVLCSNNENKRDAAFDSLYARVTAMKLALRYMYDHATVRNICRELVCMTLESYLQQKVIGIFADFYDEAYQTARRLSKHIPLEDEQKLLQTAEGASVHIADEATRTARLKRESSFFTMDTKSTTSKSISYDVAPRGYEPFNFVGKAATRMEQPERMIPLHVLDEIIKNPMHTLPDPQRATNAFMHYSRLWRNGKLYNAEVLYEKSTNTIYHFLYTRESKGPLGRLGK